MCISEMSNRLSHNHYLPSTTAFIREEPPSLNATSQDDISRAASSKSEAPLHSPTTTGTKKRRSRSKGRKQISRSFSTPQLRDAAMSDSDSDKKRNKLGYQRISIACGKC